MAVSEQIPSPADQPDPSAEDFLRELRGRGARIFRMRIPPQVFCLTQDPEVARWLHEVGASSYLPRSAEHALGGPAGAYQRARGGAIEWDFWVHLVPVAGEETIWEAAGRLARTVEADEFS